MSELLDVNQAAEYLTVHRATVYRLVKDKRLRPTVSGHFTMTEIERYLRSTQESRHRSVTPLPNRWTLYRFFDGDGALLYVGITGHGAGRWAQHSKYQPWWLEVATIRVEHHPTLESVASAELEAIRSEQPRHNKAGR